MATKQKLLGAAAGFGTDDPDFEYTTLLLDFDGTSGDNNNTITDSSTNGFTITKNGSVTQGSFSPHGDNWSNSFDGNSDALTIPDSTDFDFGTGDFTMEAWIYPRTLNDANNYNSIVSAHNPTAGSPAAQDSWIFTVLNNQTLSIYGSGAITSSSNATVPLNKWSHVMITRSSGTIRFFINGTLDTNTPTVTGNFNCPSSGVAIGRQANPDTYTHRYWNGWISNLRLVKGTALHTSSFTPSTAPLTAVTNTVLLACQSNRFIDNSSSSHTLTPTGTVAVTPFSPFERGEDRTLTADGGSGYFDGSGDYLTASDNAAFSFGTGNFTVEAWVYLTGGGGAIWSNGPTSAGSFGFYFQGTNELRCDYYGGTGLIGTTQVPDYVWHHVAVIRNGSTLSLYLNGAREATTTTSSNNTTDSFAVGRAWTNHAPGEMQGYISDFRVVKGTALYTGTSYTVPTAPLTAVTNTSALLNFQDAGIFDRSGINNIDTVGDARLGFAPIYGLRALAFDGTGDYLELKNDQEVFDLGTGDFTVECWFNANSLSATTYSTLFGCHNGGSSEWGAYVRSNGVFVFGSAGVLTGAGTVSTSTWHHYAATRSGSTVRVFLNGTQVDTDAVSGSYTTSAIPFRVGIDGGQNGYFDGFIDDLRITRGVARYTSDFTPPDEIDLSTDTHREYVTLFLTGEGPVNGQNNTFTDSSTNGFTVTESGSVVQGVFSPYGDNWSNYFGSGNKIKTAGSSDFAFGTGDFSIDFWMNSESFSSIVGVINTQTNDSSAGAGMWYLEPINSTTLRFGRHGFAQYVDGATSFSVNTWHHIHVSRVSSTVRLFVDGVSLSLTNTGGGLDTYNFNSNGINLTVGSAAPNFFLPGYMSNVRIIKGTSSENKTSNFTPPTGPLTAVTNTVLLACQSNRFVDNSSSSHTFSVDGTPNVSRFSPFESDKPYDIATDGGSGYFNYGPYLTLPQNTAFNFGTGDFTVEFWANVDTYRTSGSYYDAFVTFGFYTSSPYFRMGQDGKFKAGLVGIELSSTTVLNTFEWYHLAVTRSGTTVNLFVNGTLEATNTHSASLGNSAAVTVGTSSWQAANEEIKGYLSDVRIVKGSAVYTSSFTPPTAPLTAVTNTSALLNFQDSAIPDLSGINNIDTVGDAKVAGSDPTKYGSNSLQLDGSGDYLTFDHSLNEISFGTGDFTIEGWFYIQSGDEYPYAFDFRNTGSQAAVALYFYNYGNGSIDYYVSGASRILGTSAGNDVWQHIAVCRSGTSTKMFVNGTQSGSTYTDSTNYTAYSGNIGIKYDNVRPFKGFMDDIRISKGVARYTANFTPPIKALPKH